MEEFSGWCYSPGQDKEFVWSTLGETWASSDGGAIWIKQDGTTVETAEGVSVAGREPSFMPWMPIVEEAV